MILIFNVYLKNIEGIDLLIKLCFSCGISFMIELLELEICVVILCKKVEEWGVELLEDVVYLIG